MINTKSRQKLEYWLNEFRQDLIASKYKGKVSYEHDELLRHVTELHRILSNETYKDKKEFSKEQLSLALDMLEKIEEINKTS